MSWAYSGKANASKRRGRLDAILEMDETSDADSSGSGDARLGGDGKIESLSLWGFKLRGPGTMGGFTCWSISRFGWWMLNWEIICCKICCCLGEEGMGIGIWYLAASTCC